MENNIVLDRIAKIFKKKDSVVRAVDNVSFEIKGGELFGLLGPNGAGKTTLIKCISTLLIPDQGTAYVAGYDVRKEPLEVRRRIGVLTGGERTLYWKLTTVDNLKYFAALYGVPKKETKRRIEYLLNLMELEDKANESVERLSSGMKQKLAFARALIHDPPILLVDEPTIGLDPYFARYIRKFIREELSQNQKKTILLTTHYMEEADELCDRVAFMNRGRIDALDTPEALKKNMPQDKVLEIKCLGDFEFNILNRTEGISSLNISKQDGFIYIRAGTDNPESVLSRMLELIQNKTKILGVNVTTPTLEDVFVHLTGASLKESQNE